MQLLVMCRCVFAPGHLPPHPVIFLARLRAVVFDPLGDLTILLEQVRDEVGTGGKHAGRSQHPSDGRYRFSKPGTRVETHNHRLFTVLIRHLLPRGELLNDRFVGNIGTS